MDPLGLESFLAKALKLGRKIPAGMSNPHGHHIVFKGAFTNNPDMRAELDRSISVLNKYGITDIVNDPSNLMIANNGPGVHTVENAKKVADRLEKVDKKISKKLKSGKIDQATANKQMQCQLLKIGYSVFGHYR